jgi:hypothetical protein
MTEEEWLVSENAKEMLQCLQRQHNVNRRKIGRRKIRLFGCASCRLLWNAMVDDRSRSAVEYIERLMEDQADVTDLSIVRDRALQATIAHGLVRLNELSQLSRQELQQRHKATQAAYAITREIPWSGHAHPAIDTYIGDGDPVARRNWLSELRDLSHLLHDIFGNPFRPITFDPAWLTSTAIQLARGIYDDRAFDRMPILADALQDAGCENATILDHCRGPGPHARGCFVVDLLLGKG